ncbi:MAG: hypothetical protein HYT80_01500 [Euryarchaeota archaeon]|nr:hypothetical protein [Euryarchaeota archaeon]
MKISVCVLSLVVFLSGCAEKKNCDPVCVDPYLPEYSEAAAPDPFAKPMTWVKGRWWKYASASGSGDPTTLIVTEVGSGAYTLDTTSRMQAAFDAETDVSYVGPIEKSSLSGNQGNKKVEYFRWPLAAGKEWSTQWDGQTRVIKAVGASGDEFEVEASELGKPRVRYSYNAKAGFFGHLSFLDASGNVQFGLKLSDFGENYTGPYVRASVKALVPAIDLRDQPSQQSNQAFKVDATVHEMVLRFDVKCNPQAGSWSLTVKPQDAASAQTEGHQDSSPPSTCTKALNKTMEKPKVGDWIFDSKATLVTGPNYLRISLVARTYQDFSM